MIFVSKESASKESKGRKKMKDEISLR